MISQPVVINGKGWIDFDKNLHFDVTPQLNEIVILKSKSSKKGTTSLVGGIISIEVSGNIDKFDCKAKISPVKAIKNATEYLMEGLKGIFDGVF